MTPCPCCGQPVAEAVALDTVAWFVPPTLAQVVRTLARAGGGPLHIEALVGGVWISDHAAPVHATASVRNAIRRGRPALQRLGWDVVNIPHAHGFALVRYKNQS